MSPDLSALLSIMPISQLYEQLTDMKPRRVGAHRYRAVASWRGGEDLSVALDDQAKGGVWHDKVTDEGGGKLDLIRRVKGGTRGDAVRWLSSITGISLPDQKFSRAAREEYYARRRRIEKTLPVARSWHRIAGPLTEELLYVLKAAVNGRPAAFKPSLGEITQVESFGARLRRPSDERLIAEYEQFLRRDPFLTGAMIQVSQIHQRADERWLRSFLEDDGERRRNAA